MEFTGIRDVDLKIFSELDDISLLRVCSVNRNIRNHVCKDENFWRNRFVSKYGDVATIVVKYKPEKRTWKDHYLQVLIDLDMYSKDPIRFLDNIAWDKDIKNSFYMPLDKSFEKKNAIPLVNAPEWVLNNLYLLKVGNEIPIRDIILKSPKPIDLLNNTSAPRGRVINGFYPPSSLDGKYYPIIALLR